MAAPSLSDYLFMPKHIVLVGASERAHSMGERVLTSLLGAGFRGKITPVNLRHKTVAGLQSFAGLHKIDEPVDLVVALTRPESYDGLLRTCRKKQFHHVLAIQEWTQLSAEEWQTAAAAFQKHHSPELRISVCHPAGIQIPALGLNTGTLADFPGGHLAVLSGSQALSSSLHRLLAPMRQGVSRHICLNYLLSPTTAADWMNRFDHHRHTRAALVEHNPHENQRALFSAIGQFTRRTPLVLYMPHHTDETERALILSLSRRYHFLPVFERDQLSAALHAVLSDIPPCRHLAVLADTEVANLQSRAHALGLSLHLPDKVPQLRQGSLGSQPPATLFRSLVAAERQNPQHEAVLAVIEDDDAQHAAALTRILSSQAGESGTPLLISSRHSDGLLQFATPEQALQAAAFRNQIAERQQLSQQTAPPKTGRLKTPQSKNLLKALAAKDDAAMAEALHLPPHRSSDPMLGIEIVFDRHPHYGLYAAAHKQGRTTAVLPPFNSSDTAHLAAFTGLTVPTVRQLLHTFNTLDNRNEYFGGISVYLSSEQAYSSFRPSESELSRLLPPLPPKTSAAAAMQNAADYLRHKNPAAAEFLRQTGEAAAGLLGHKHAANTTIENVLAPYPHTHTKPFTLADGRSIRIRPFEPEDAQAKQTFVRELDAEARYSRFHTHTNELPPATLARLSKLDYHCEGAFLAEDADGRILAVSRFARINRQECEFGITVAQDARGSGLAAEMMQRIIVLATQQGYQSMRAEILKTNTAMRKLAEKSGFTLQDSPNDPQLYQAKRPLFQTASANKRPSKQ